MYDLAIIGGGTAGLTAAIYGMRAGLTTLVLEGQYPGGQIVNTPDIANYPGILSITGADFANHLYEQAEHFGTKLIFEGLKHCDLSQTPKVLQSENNIYHAKAVVIATGAQHREIGCKGEEKLKGKGVSYCATCDGAFFQNKDVCVIGGGNTALDDALYLAKFCKQVHLVHRRDTFRGSKHTVNLVSRTNNITLHLNYQVIEILGDKQVRGIVLQQSGSQVQKELAVSGVFIAIGLKPENERFASFVELDSNGYILSDESCATKTPGVFVAGDTRSKAVRQLVTAASDGAVSATGAAHYIEHLANMN